MTSFVLDQMHSIAKRKGATFSIAGFVGFNKKVKLSIGKAPEIMHAYTHEHQAHKRH